MKTISFSAYWTDALAAAILARAPEFYTASLVGEDAAALVEAVNQGIDSHLEACFVPDRGDSFTPDSRTLTAVEDCKFWKAGDTLTLARTVECRVSRQSLAVLVRRLMELGTEAGDYLASGICSTLDIELI